MRFFESMNNYQLWICIIINLLNCICCHWSAQVHRVIPSENLDPKVVEIEKKQFQQTKSPPGISVIYSRLIGIHNFGYYVMANIGTPPQKVKLVIDTGSSNTAVAGPKFPQLPARFQPAFSSSFQTLNILISIIYASGHWTGVLGSDIVSLDGVLFQGINTSAAEKIAPTPFRTRFSVIKNARSFFSLSGNDWSGILGLAYPLLMQPPSLSDKSTLLDDLTSQLGLDNRFSVALCGFANNQLSTHVSGHFIIGGSNSSLYEGPLVYVPVRRRWYYEILISGLSVLGNPVVMSSCREYNLYKTILDTGTSLTLFSRPVYNSLVSLIRRAAQPRMPPMSPSPGSPPSDKAYSLFWAGSALLCLPATRGINASLASLFPEVDIDLVINDTASVRLALSPQNYLTLVMAQSDVLGRQRYCFKLGFGISNAGTILGDTFMEGFYFIFDRNKDRVGIAKSRCNSYLPNEKPSRIIKIMADQAGLLSCASKNLRPPVSLFNYITSSLSIVLCLIFGAVLLPIIIVLMYIQCRGPRSHQNILTLSEASSNPRRDSIFTKQSHYQSVN